MDKMYVRDLKFSSLTALFLVGCLYMERAVFTMLTDITIHYITLQYNTYRKVSASEYYNATQ